MNERLISMVVELMFFLASRFSQIYRINGILDDKKLFYSFILKIFTGTEFPCLSYEIQTYNNHLIKRKFLFPEEANKILKEIYSGSS